VTQPRPVSAERFLRFEDRHQRDHGPNPALCRRLLPAPVPPHIDVERDPPRVPRQRLPLVAANVPRNPASIPGEDVLDQPLPLDLLKRIPEVLDAFPMKCDAPASRRDMRKLRDFNLHDVLGNLGGIDLDATAIEVGVGEVTGELLTSAVESDLAMGIASCGQDIAILTRRMWSCI